MPEFQRADRPRRADATAPRPPHGWDPDHPEKVDRFTGALYFFVGLFCSAIGLGGLVMAGFGVYDLVHDRTGSAVSIGVAVAGVFIALFLVVGVRGVWLGIRCFLPAGVPRTEISPLYAEMLKGEIVYRGAGHGVVVTLLLGIWILVLSALFAVALTGGFSSDNFGTAVVSGAALLALGAGLSYLVLQGRKFGKSICRLQTRPAIIGEALAAEVIVEFPKLKIGLPELPEDAVRVVLRHIGAGKSMAADWQSETHVAVEALQRPGDGTLRIPVRIAIPSEAKDKAGYGHWRLRVAAAYPGIDYASEFVVPVVLRTG